MFKDNGVKPFVEQWTEHLAKLNTAILREFFNLLKDVAAADIGPGHLQMYAQHLKDEGRTQGEVTRRLNRIRMFLAFCIANELFTAGKALGTCEELVIAA